jgi:pyruvate dehydrogenase (quinone)
VHTEAPTVRPSDSDVDALAAAIDAAERVTLFCGAGVRAAHDEVVELAGKIKAPVGHSLRGKEWIQHDNPYDVGMTGLLGYGACHNALRGADLIVMLGTDFPYDQFLPDVRTAQVDLAPERIGRRTAVDVAVAGDVGETLRALIPRVAAKRDDSFARRMVRNHDELMTKVVGAYTRNVETVTPIHPEYAATLVDELTADDAVYTVDTGMCNVWAARYLTPNGRRRMIGSFVHGSMANALPQAIGAQLAYPGRQVVSLSGDGGLSMLLGDLITVRDLGLPVKIVLFDNATLGMVKLEMMVDGLPSFGTDVPETDYAAVARALGIHAVRVERPGEITGELRSALAHDGPALLDLVTDPLALSVPPEITGSQVRGFALAASRMILGGGTAQAVQMARSNLRNIPRP